MGLSTERKVFLVVGVAAVAALVIDRGVLAPSGAHASSMPIEPVVTTIDSEPISAVMSADSFEPAAEILNTRLESIKTETSQDLGVAFSLTKILNQSESNEHIEDVDGVAESDMDESNSFVLVKHDPNDLPSLSAVMPSKKGGAAVIDGAILRVGQSSDSGFILASVSHRSVILTRGGHEYSVSIPSADNKE